MVDSRDLSKLGRGDLLDLLLEQCQENDRLEARVKKLAEGEAQLREDLRESEDRFTRLKKKLDQKDFQIERLKKKLDEKDEEIDRLCDMTEEDPKTLAEAAIKVSKVLEAAQAAGNRYIEGAKAIEQKRREAYAATMKRCREMEAEAGASTPGQS